MLWREDIGLEVLLFSKHHIHKIVRHRLDGESLIQEYFLIGVYGHLELAHIGEVWSLIKSIGRRMLSPWVVFGDFNEIL